MVVKKFQSSVIIIFILIIFNIFIYTELETAVAATDDQNLFGIIYKSDGSALADDPANKDDTEFCIWVNHNSDWIRYPISGWEVTSGGWYSYTLPEFDKGINWDHGDMYLVQVNGVGWGELNDNCTSHGTGGTDVGGIPGQGVNEFTPAATTYNIVNWEDTSNTATPDNTQQWNVVTSKIDLTPANITINGILYPGPYSQQTIGPVIVDLNSTINISAKAANLGEPGLIKPTTLMFIDEYNNNKILNSGVVDSISALGFAPKTGIRAIWKSPAVSGDYNVNVIVDYYDNVTETDELNNLVKIIFSVKSLDIEPWDVMVNGLAYTNPRTVPIGENVHISGRVKNSGAILIEDTFSLAIENDIGETFTTVNIQGLGPGNISADLVEIDWSAEVPGIYIFNVTVDLPENKIQEFNESNNIFTVIIIVEGPDLVPWNVKINGIPYSNTRTVSLGSKVTITGRAKNIGYVDVTEKFSLRLMKDKNEILSELAVEQLAVDEVSSEMLNYEWIPDTLGRFSFNVTVDLPKNNILEFNENNNRYRIEFIVVGSLMVDIAKTVNKNKADPGDELTYTIFFNNTGDYTIPLVKINDTLPTGVYYTNDNAKLEPGFGSRMIDGDLIMFVFNTVETGSHSFTITAYINTSVKGGTELENWVSMDYMDKNGNLITGLVGYARTLVMAPKLRIIKNIDVSSAGPNAILRYKIIFNNSGDTNSATVRITDTLPEGLTYVSDTSLNVSNYAYRSINGSSLEFVFANVEVGEYNFTITVKINRNATTNISLNNWAVLNYTDARGNELKGVKDNATIWIEPGGGLFVLMWPSADSELETNYKPVISLLFCAVLVTISLLVGFNRPLRIINRSMTDLEITNLDRTSRIEVLTFNRLFTCLLLAVPIPLIEGIIGIVSYYTEILMIPPWWGAGMIVNLIILIIGIILNIWVLLKGEKDQILEEDI